MFTGGHNHYNDGRPQKSSRPEKSYQSPHNSYDRIPHSGNNSSSHPTSQFPKSQADRRGETAYFDYVDRQPDPSKCKSCQLAKEELAAGLVALLAHVEAEETTPEGDMDILRCAAELRRLLSTRNNKKHQRRMKELDELRPNEGEYVMVPEYIGQRMEKAKDLPSLPPIEPSLQAQVFTHADIHDKAGRIRGVSSTDDLSYERLEFVGDAYLELMATRLISHRLPHLDVPAQALLREQLVKNDTLSAISLRYGLPDRLKHSHITEGKAWKKITADVFEAYVAAVVLSDPVDGFLVAENWMNQLWAEQMLSYRKPVLVENEKAQEELTKLIFVNQIKISYVDEKNMEMTREGVQRFVQGVYLTGWGYENEWLGSGEGRNKSQAAVNAAQDALTRNSHVLQTAARKKQEFIAIQQIERDQRRETLRKLADEGDGDALAELRRSLFHDIRVKKKLATKGNEDAAAQLEELVAEEEALVKKFGVASNENGKCKDAASTQKANKSSGTNGNKQHEKNDNKPEEAKAVKQANQREDFLAAIISGGKGNNTAPNEAKKDGGSYMEREQKKKAKEEKRMRR